jgi:hypothetical protein
METLPSYLFGWEGFFVAWQWIVGRTCRGMDSLPQLQGRGKAKRCSG